MHIFVTVACDTFKHNIALPQTILCSEIKIKMKAQRKREYSFLKFLTDKEKLSNFLTGDGRYQICIIFTFIGYLQKTDVTGLL